MENNILEFKNITKLYPGVTALDKVSLSFVRGEVHALAGENGAGKSTLIKTLSGAISPTSGSIFFEGKEYEALTPELSQKLGIAVVYQELMLVPVLTVVENIFMGDFIRHGWMIDMPEMVRQTKELFRQLDIDLDPMTPVEQLTTGFQQIVEIAKAVSKNAKLLIMDEPSAPLTEKEVESMFRIIETLRKKNVTIIYISHRLDEIFRIADRVSVIRDGQYVMTKDVKDTDREELVRYMVGRTLKETYPEHECTSEEVVMSLEKVGGNGVKDISFELHRGEILGLGGLIGAGRTELAEILFGYCPMQSGTIRFKDRNGHFKMPAHAVRDGISLVPEDRKTLGVIQEMSIKDNIEIPSLKSLCKAKLFPDRKKEEELVRSQIEALAIKTPSVNQLVRNLSGGNQQKVVLAKWIGANSDVLILDEPTRGIDVGAKHEIYKIMVDLTKEGKSIIMISSDMQELLGMSDRIIVLCKGRQMGEIKREEFSQERVLSHAAGIVNNP